MMMLSDLAAAMVTLVLAWAVVEAAMRQQSIRTVLSIVLLLQGLLGSAPVSAEGEPSVGIYYLPLLAYPEEAAPKPIPLLCSPLDAAVTLDMECSQVDAPDNDHQNLNEEYVCLRGHETLATQLADWRVSDLHPRYHTYRFGQFGLEAGATAKLHSGHGADTAVDLYWGYHHAIWNNGGDTFCLYSNSGVLVQACDYGRAIEEGVSPEAHCAPIR